VVSLQENLRLGKARIVDVIENGVKPVYKLTTSLGKEIVVSVRDAA
jgi:hypothetical protein